jgi:hypothetical protein
MFPQPGPGRPRREALMTPADFRRLGEALFGKDWKTPLARELQMHPDSVRHYASGENPVHAGIVADLVKIVFRRRQSLSAWHHSLSQRLPRGADPDSLGVLKTNQGRRQKPEAAE